jgi:hypothetical protein
VALRICLLLLCTLLACNLTNEPPTPTPQPTFTPQPPVQLPFATSTSSVSPNPNCATTPPGWIAYTVEPGDSMSLLAIQTDSTIDELVAGNCLPNPDTIEVGTVMYLPRQPVITP